MTEEEYINVRDLERITSAKGILRNLLPETSEIIDKDVHGFIMSSLSDWERKLYTTIELKSNE